VAYLSSGGLVQNKTTIALIAASLVGILLVWMSSFRLGFGNLELAWQVNLERIALTSAAGIALASASALSNDIRSHIRLHIIGFALISSAASMLLLGATLEWPLVFTMCLVVFAGVSVTWVASYALRYGKSLNLWSAAILSLSFGLSLSNFLTASYLGGGIGGLVYWLQGSLLNINNFSYLALLLGLCLFVWVIKAQRKEIPLYLLIGLGVGLAGPIFFIACLAAMLVRCLTQSSNEKLHLSACASVGALVLVFADSVPRLLVGGYPTGLIIPISLFAIPTLLYYQRKTLLHEFPSKARGIVEASIIAIWLLGFLFIFYHVVQFAMSAT